MRLEPARPDDLGSIRVEDTPELARMREAVMAMPNVGDIMDATARTLFHGEQPVACFGVWPMWEGVGRAWAYLGLDSLSSFGAIKALHRAVRGCLVEIEERDGMWRIEAVVRFGHIRGHAWMRHLGFVREALMRRYNEEGVDYHLYARVRCP